MKTRRRQAGVLLAICVTSGRGVLQHHRSEIAAEPSLRRDADDWRVCC